MAISGGIGQLRRVGYQERIYLSDSDAQDVYWTVSVAPSSPGVAPLLLMQLVGTPTARRLWRSTRAECCLSSVCFRGLNGLLNVYL